MKKLLFVSSLLFSQIAFSQDDINRLGKTVYVLYGHHFKTDYLIDSGQNNLVGRKNVFSAEIGLNLDYALTNRWMLRTGISGHFLFLDEIGYGITGPLPGGITFPYTHIYRKGLEYVESTTVGIPFKGLFRFNNLKNYVLSVSGGPFLSFYFPARDEMAGFGGFKQNGQFTQDYWVTRRFNSGNKGINISSPQLEWDFDMDATRALKKYGAITLGVKTHIGTKRLERASFVIWPDEPGYTSKGHFTLNRSYIGIFGGFRFGKNQSRKSSAHSLNP